MKPIAIIAFGIGALALGALGGTIRDALKDQPEQQLTPDLAANTSQADTDVPAETEDNSLLIASLQTKVEDLEAAMARFSSEREIADEPVATPVAAIHENVPSRDVILGVLQQEEDRKEEERRLEREQREQDALTRRIERIAEKLSLSSADQATLSQIYTEERQKQTEMWTAMRDGGMDRDMIREGMTEVRDWRTEQLNLSFGEDLAGQISEESGGRGWGDWGGGRGNNDGGGGRGGRGGRGN